MNSGSAGALTIGAESTILLLAQKELAPYSWGKVIESETCWVHNGVGSIEYHHIVPRNSGGENGPQVAICGNCHTGVHNLAFKSILFDGQVVEVSAVLSMVEKLSTSWLRPKVKWRDTALLRAWALAQVIYRAKLLVTKDEANKLVKFSTTFKGDTSRMLKTLAKMYGVNQEQAITLLIQDAYARLVGDLT